MRTLFACLFAALALAAVGVAAPDRVTATPTQLRQNPERYDGKAVMVSGTIRLYSERVSRRDEPYTTFSLADQNTAVRVYSRRHEGLSEGMEVTVTGRFNRERASGSHTFYNEIEADTVKPSGR